MKNNNKILFVIVSTGILCFLSCSNQTEIPLPPTTSADLGLSITATSSVLMSDEEVASIVNQDNYLKGCREKYNSAPEAQMGFNDIYPGVSTVDDVLERFGKPYEKNEIGNGEEEYFYSDKITSFAYFFYITNDVVESITISKDKVLLDVQDVLETYGCPNLIVAGIEDSHSNSNSLNGINFWYLKSGVVIGFNRYPIKLSTPYVAISYQAPVELASFDFDRYTFTPVTYLSAVINSR